MNRFKPTNIHFNGRAGFKKNIIQFNTINVYKVHL